MTEKIYFIENIEKLEDALEYIINAIPCFLERELVEMNYSKITIKANNADIATVERILAPFV